MNVRLLTDADAAPAWALSQLAFGWLDRPAPATLEGQTVVGAEGEDGLVGMARLRSYEQWWGGRPVPMGGIASVAVHPHARGRGTAGALMRELLVLMRARQQPVSTLFPTAPGIYRSLGWEVVGSLDDTVLPTSALRAAGDPGRARVRSAGPADVPAIAELYDEYARDTGGLLTRRGPEFPGAPEGVLDHDVVAVAELDGEVAGYTTYSRGSGYRQSQLRVWELMSRSPAATAALLRSIGTWDAVATTTSWRGPTEQIARVLPATLPPPTSVQPWMLRIVDAPAAVAARGFEGDADAAFALVDPQVPEHEGGWRLTVRDGRGQLDRSGEAGLPQLHVRGLALLYAGAARTAGLVRSGLLDRPDPLLDQAFRGQPPQILDYF